MRRVLFFVLFSVGCSATQVVPEPLAVGPGPCSDFILHSPEGGIAHGCMNLLLVEATATPDTTGYLVEGRIIAGGVLEPVPGVVVHVLPEGRRGVLTDLEGRYVLDSLNADDWLRVAPIGFWPDTLRVGSLPGPRYRFPSR